jgi:hypothetical protein
MTSRIHPHSEHADFIEHVERNRVTACESFFPSGERTFIRFTTLREYLTPMNIRRLLLCYFPTGTYWRAVHNGDYLVVFSILVYINKVSFLPYFLSNRRLSDQSLPFPHHYDWPRPCREFFYMFSLQQWQFCAQRFVSDGLYDLRIDERIILPIKSTAMLHGGTDFSVYKVEMYDEYNLISEKARAILFILWQRKLTGMTERTRKASHQCLCPENLQGEKSRGPQYRSRRL